MVYFRATRLVHYLKMNNVIHHVNRLNDQKKVTGQYQLRQNMHLTKILYSFMKMKTFCIHSENEKQRGVSSTL